MKIPFYIICAFAILFAAQATAQTKIIDSTTTHPVSFATISFGDGQGVFADEEGLFVFTNTLYRDVDSLFISALGYKSLTLPTHNLPKIITMEADISTLDEVLVTAKIDRKFKKETIKPYLDNDYYKCWLPTIESEIAVFFPNENEKLKKITAVVFPITLESSDWKKRKRSNTDKRKFSTLFKVKFYKNNNGSPGDVMTYSTIVFRATEKNGDTFQLEVSEHDLFIPNNGFFVSLQVLGYTDTNGKLLPNKKYKEIKSKNGYVKIPTNFRPLLPFTDKITGHNTFIKRVFINGNNWVQFKKGKGIESGLLKNNLNNYGIGINYNIYKDE